jgi:hypothetical protein
MSLELFVVMFNASCDIKWFYITLQIAEGTASDCAVLNLAEVSGTYILISLRKVT